MCIVHKMSAMWACHAAGVDIDEYPNLSKWVKKIAARPAVQKGLSVPKRSDLVDLLNDDSKRKQTLQDALEKIKKAEESQQ